MRFERDFTQLPNTWLRDERLSYRARGLLAMLMSHEAGYRITLKAISAASPREGIDAMREAVRELEAVGYLRRHAHKSIGRYEGDDWELCDPHNPGDNPGEALWTTASDDPTRPGNRVGSSNVYRVGSSNAHKNTEENTSRGRARATTTRPDTPRQPCLQHRFIDANARHCEDCGYTPSEGLFLDFTSGLYRTAPR